MGRLAGISGRDAVKAFIRAGYRFVWQRGSHVILVRDGFPSLTIPAHPSVSPFLLRSQIRRAGLTDEEFLNLLSTRPKFNAITAPLAPRYRRQAGGYIMRRLCLFGN